MARVQRTPPPSTLLASTIKAYALPFILFLAAILYHLFLNSSHPSHYQVLQIDSNSSIQTVHEAYHKLESKWSLKNSDVEVSDIREFIKIRYAYEFLTNPIRKRDYDTFGIDEEPHLIESASKLYAGKNISQLKLPLLHWPSGFIDHTWKNISMSDFQSLFPDAKPWIIQLYSLGSNRSAEFSKSCNKIASLLDGLANIGAVELGEKELSVYLADKRSTGKPFFRNGIPSLIAIPPRCRAPKCFRRFDGELTVDEVTNWVATTVLTLPQIYYHFTDSLILRFFGKISDHKVKVMFFSKTGERASPFIRQAAKDYRAYASFAFILWREKESADWQEAFGVESAPAVMFLEDLHIKPVVYHGSMNNSFFLNMMENHKQQELQQLRFSTLRELGCDYRCHSRAGCETLIWYCAIAVGRPSMELNRMRETMRRVQKTISEHREDASSYNQSLAPVVDAYKRKRLTFSWLDGEKQEDFCLYHLGLPAGYDSCRQWEPGLPNVPRLFIIRYQKIANKRNPEMTKCKDRPSCICGIAGQFTSVYEGEADVSQIIEWLTNQVTNGDSLEVPFNIPQTPKFIRDDIDTESYWISVFEMIHNFFADSPMSVRLKSLKQSILGELSVYREDPRIAPALLLGALFSFSTIWLRRSQRVDQFVWEVLVVFLLGNTIALVFLLSFSKV